MTTNRTRTLVVTLDPGLIQQVRTALEERGGAVSACPTGEGAEDEVGLRAYGLVVVSAELPDGDGFELTSRLKDVDDGISVMLIGDDRDGRSVERANDCGASGFLHRPVSTAELFQRFESVMGGTWFRVPAESDTISRHADSVVDPLSGVFPAETGYDFSVQDHDEGLAVEDVGPPSPTGTQELPALAMEMFDEDNPVSIPVAADITAHGMAPIAAHDVSGVLDTGDIGLKSAEELVDERIDVLLADGGALRTTIESVVQQALADALAQQLPAFLAQVKGGSE